MRNEDEKVKQDAAARWLLDEVEVRGKYARLVGRTHPVSEMHRGVWYLIRSHNARGRTLSLDVDGTEVTMPIQYLRVQADLPEKTTVYTEGKWAERPGDMVYVGVCPKGHEHQLGPVPPAAGLRHGPECNRDYDWVWELHDQNRN